MAGAFRAWETQGDGKLALVERPVEAPGPGMVRVAVEACGVCHTDSLTVEGGFPGLQYPRVPGHEAVGRIEALGEGVREWTVGERVGVGFPTGRCGVCPRCRRGDLINCERQGLTGIHVDGGYAEMMTANQFALVAIPGALQSVEAAPLQCAGVTTFKALRKSFARAGDLVAVQGVGGLGHLAVQFAHHMGFRTVAIDMGAEKAPFAKEMGALRYVDSKAEDPVAVLKEMGRAKVIVATASNPATFGPLLAGLQANGQLMVIGAGAEPLTVNIADLLFEERTISGTNTGTPVEIEDTLAFSQMEDIKARIEVVPFDQAPAAYAKMMANQARFRMVLDMVGAGEGRPA